MQIPASCTYIEFTFRENTKAFYSSLKQLQLFSQVPGTELSPPAGMPQPSDTTLWKRVLSQSTSSLNLYSLALAHFHQPIMNTLRGNIKTSMQFNQVHPTSKHTQIHVFLSKFKNAISTIVILDNKSQAAMNSCCFREVFL